MIVLLKKRIIKYGIFFAKLLKVICIAIKRFLVIFHKTINVIKTDTFWLSVIFQPLLIILFGVYFEEQLLPVILTGQDFGILICCLQCVVMVFMLLLLNMVIEIVARLIKKENQYKSFIRIQKYINNYALIIISLCALYVAVFSKKPDYENNLLFIIGVIFFANTIIYDLYEGLFYSQNIVENIIRELDY